MNLKNLKNRVVYIAGPITGRLDTYKQEFAEADNFLIEQGAVVLNPAVLPIGLNSHQSYMNICLPMLREAEVLVLLAGWEASEGAMLEVKEARTLGMPIFELVRMPSLVPLPVPANDNAPASELDDASVTERLNEATHTVLAAVPALMDEKFKLELESPVDMAMSIVGAGSSDIEQKAAAAEELSGKVIALLRENPGLFSANELADLNELTDAELTKRDAAVCGGQKYIDAHWFERGELPPVGTVCEVLWNEGRMEYLRTKVFGVNEHGQPIHRFDEGPKKFEYQADPLVTVLGTRVFRPIRTERDKAAPDV